MSFKNLFNIKAAAGAFGLVAAMAAGSASAAINWGIPYTFFEDDDLDFLIQANGETDGILRVGDILVSVLELNDANGVGIAPEELTGVAVIEILAIADIDGNGVLDIIFGPATAGFNAITGVDIGADGNAGGSAMVAFYLDPTPNLKIDAGAVIAGTETCQTMAGCIAQATDGNAWLTLGIEEASDYWVALNAALDTNVVKAGNPAIEYGTVNTGLSILDNQTGVPLLEEQFSCAPLCGGDGTNDIQASGSVKGGFNGGANGGEWIATSDFDMIVARVPVPGTLALMGLGLLGLGSARRRK